MNFVWSLRPIFIWLTISMGVDLDRSSKRSNIGRWLLRIYSLFWFFCFSVPVNAINMAIAVVDIRVFLSSAKRVEKSVIAFLNREIAWISIYILYILFHFSVLVAALVKWKPLWNKLERVQSDTNDQTTSYRQLRRETFVGLVFIPTVIMAFAHSFYSVTATD